MIWALDVSVAPFFLTLAAIPVAIVVVIALVALAIHLIRRSRRK